MKALLKNNRQSPRKVRLIADMVRGKDVTQALSELAFTPTKAAQTVQKVIQSAADNAKNNFKVDPSQLIIKEIRVDEGFTMKRFRARAMGRAARIRKRTSHIMVNLANKAPAK